VPQPDNFGIDEGGKEAMKDVQIPTRFPSSNKFEKCYYFYGSRS
jgi:hypothetical protein